MLNETGTVALSDVEQDQLAQILDEYLTELERGGAVSPAAMLARYPQHAEQLRGYLSGLELFHAAAGRHEHGTAANGSLVRRLRSNDSIGGFRLVREIGRGGMGVVYEAWQESLNRHVALKILPFTSANDAKQIGRFKNEAQAAAHVQHPHIVPVYEVGEDAGVHYYAMQLIGGQSLGALLEQMRSQSSPTDRTTVANNTLTLVQKRPASLTSGTATGSNAKIVPNFATAVETVEHVRMVGRLGWQAAAALHAAHEYGVTHRDIKPSNLLVDEHGKLWISDFGLARCRENAGLTQTGDVLGTMRYMSPEQARGQTALIDYRTDVYSLGVTLYELATLHHPAEGVSDIALYFERDGRGPKALRQWNRFVSLDFQTIVLKAMAELPQERYATAQEMADDLGRFLEDRPVLASPPTWRSRSGKWLRRHRRPVLAAAVVLVMSLAALSLVRMRGHAATQRALTNAKQNLQQTRSVVDVMSTLGDQLAAIPGAEGVRHQLLEDCLGYYQRLEKDSASDPAFLTDRAFALAKLGDLSEKLGESEQAAAAYQTAIKICESRLEQSPNDVTWGRNLALCRGNLALLVSEQGRPADAVKLLSSAITLQNRLIAQSGGSPELSADMATTHSNLAAVYSRMGKKQEALQESKAAISLEESTVQVGSSNEQSMRTLAAGYNNLGSLVSGDPAASVDAYRRAIDIQTKLVTANPLNRLCQGDLARTYSNLGFLFGKLQQWNNAEKSFDDAIRLQEQLMMLSPLAGAYRRDLAISHNNLGMIRSRRGLFDEAKKSFELAIALQDTLLLAQGEDVQTLSNQGSVWNNLGMLYDGQQRFADAEGAYRKSIEMQSRAYEASDHAPAYAVLLNRQLASFGKCLRTEGKFDNAITCSLRRKRLAGGEAESLFAVAQELAETLRVMEHHADTATQRRAHDELIAVVSEAVGAGLSRDRLSDRAFDAIRDDLEFQRLIVQSAARLDSNRRSDAGMAALQ